MWLWPNLCQYIFLIIYYFVDAILEHLCKRNGGCLLENENFNVPYEARSRDLQIMRQFQSRSVPVQSHYPMATLPVQSHNRRDWMTPNGEPLLSHIGGTKQSTRLTLIVIIIIEVIVSRYLNCTFASIVNYYFLLCLKLAS